MSETIEEQSKSDRQNNDKEENICRDFVRGLCERKYCKYKHDSDVRMLNFCHDYQNHICPRSNCRFIHCSPEEVEVYKKTGEMSNQILAEATRKSQLPGVAPICGQFRKGFCRRANCKYRHLTAEDEVVEIIELIQNNNQRKSHQLISTNGLTSISITNIEPLPPPPTLPSLNGIPNISPIVAEDFVDCNSRKRRLISPSQEHDFRTDLILESTRSRPIFKGYFAGNPPTPILSSMDARSFMLEEENNMLHKEIAQLKRQVLDLTATNEFLLDQNANLRVSSKHNGTVPNVTMTNTNAAQQPQVIRTVTASVATVPVSLATVTTCNPVSIAGVPSVSIASPAQILAPSQQILVTTNPTTQLALATSSQQAQLAIAHQNLANNLAQQAQPQLTSQAQQLALAASTTQQLTTSQAQQLAAAAVAANQQQQLNSQAAQLVNSQQLTSSQAQQLANQQLTSQAQLAITSQAQQLALASSTQELTSQARLALAATSTQLTTQAQLAVASMPQQLALATTNQQLLAQQNLVSTPQLDIHRTNQIAAAINTSQTIAIPNATPATAMVSYPIVTHSINHALSH